MTISRLSWLVSAFVILASFSASSAPPSTPSLLAGMTPSNFKLPSGWKVAAIQDFENSSLPSGQSISSSTTCEFGHAGKCSAMAKINVDGASDAWTYTEGQLTGREFYLSYYDWGGGGAANEEYVLFHVIKHNIGGSVGFEEAGMPMVSFSKFNNTCPNIMFGPQGNFVISPWIFKTNCYFTNAWTQWEVWLQANTPGKSDGFIRLYENGVSLADQEHISIFGAVDMTGMQVEVGGWYTKNVWTDNGKYPPSGKCTSGPGDGSEAGSWKGLFGTVNAGDCPPAPPIFNRYIDDVILLER